MIVTYQKKEKEKFIFLERLTAQSKAHFSSFSSKSKILRGLPWWLSSKEPTCKAGDMCKRRQVQFLGGEDLLEKEMATHSRILAWEIPWTEELGRFSPWGCRRVGHDLVRQQQQ